MDHQIVRTHRFGGPFHPPIEYIMIRLMDPCELALILNLNYLPLKAVWSEDFVRSDKRMFVRFSSGPHAMCCEPDPSNEILQMHTCNLCVQCALSSLNSHVYCINMDTPWSISPR
jgi:hypothetical protein